MAEEDVRLIGSGTTLRGIGCHGDRLLPIIATSAAAQGTSLTAIVTSSAINFESLPQHSKPVESEIQITTGLSPQNKLDSEWRENEWD